jgi:hypothetical protein
MAAAAQGIEDHSREQLMDRKTGLRSPLGQLGPALRQDGGLSTQILVERPMLVGSFGPDQAGLYGEVVSCTCRCHTEV